MQLCLLSIQFWALFPKSFPDIRDMRITTDLHIESHSLRLLYIELHDVASSLSRLAGCYVALLTVSYLLLY